jgi:hypothetical protein
MVDNEGLKVSARAADVDSRRATQGRGPVTSGVRMKYRLYSLAVTFAAVLTAVGHVGINGAKWS